MTPFFEVTEWRLRDGFRVPPDHRAMPARDKLIFDGPSELFAAHAG